MLNFSEIDYIKRLQNMNLSSLEDIIEKEFGNFLNSNEKLQPQPKIAQTNNSK